MASGSVFRDNYYTHAIVGVVKSSVAEEADVDTYTLKYQHDYLLRILRDMNLDVMQIDLHGPYSVSLMLDRVAVSVNGLVYLPSPKSSVEEFNLTNLKLILQTELNQLVIEQSNPDARVCGADVLIQGREIFVGISETTNEAGAVELAEAFKDYPVTAIRMPRGTTHLKDYITNGGKGTVVVGPGSEAQEILSLLEREAEAFYVKLHVPEAVAANCLYLNKTLIHRAIEEIPESFRIFCEKTSCSRRSICFSEFDKLNANLSSVCLLVRKFPDKHMPQALPLGHNFL